MLGRATKEITREGVELYRYTTLRCLGVYPANPAGSAPSWRANSFGLPRANAMPSTASVTLQDALLPFQREGVAAAVERWDGRILLGDEMGLGKTIQVSPTGCSVCSC